MKRIDEIVEAIEHGKFYDGETERDAVWNKEKVEEDDWE